MSKPRKASTQTSVDRARSGYNELDDPETPVTASWTNVRAPLRTTSPETIEPVTSATSRWKGKGRAVGDESVNDAAAAQVDLGQPQRGMTRDEAEEELVSGTYPPASEAAVEEQKVNETLKRWEQLERQRRKAARESRLVSIDSTHSSFKSSSSHSRSQSNASSSDTNITRRASLFWSGKKSSTNPAPGSHPLSSTGEDDPSIMEPEPESEELGVVKEDLSSPSREAFLARRQSTSSVDSHSSAVTITLESSSKATPPEPTKMEIKITAPTPSRHSQNNTNPFIDPSTTPTPDAKGKQPMRTHSQKSNGDPFSDRYGDVGGGEDGEEMPVLRNNATLHPPPSSSKRSSKRMSRYHTPKPLLNPDSLIHEQDERGKMMRGRNGEQRVAGEEEEEAESGRWWTDWLCGCREGPDRGGEHQSGKTNPLE